MRMAPDQLLAAVIGHLGERPLAALLHEQGEEVDLEEHVPELVEQLDVIAGVRRVGQLVRLLDRVRHDRALVLLAIPGTLPPQQAGDLVQPRERGTEVVAAVRLLAGAHYGCGSSGVGAGCSGCGWPFC